MSSINNSNNNVDEEALFADWKRFLVSDRTDLRVAATQAVLEVMTTTTRAAQLVQQEMVPLLAKNCTYESGDDSDAQHQQQEHQQKVSINALQALVYLTSHGPCANQCVKDLQEAGGLNRMLEIALSRPPLSTTTSRKVWRQRVNYALSIMANLTRTEEGAVELVGRTLPEEAVPTSSSSSLQPNGDASSLLLPTRPTMELLLARFLSAAYLDDDVSRQGERQRDYYDDFRQQQGGDAALDSNDADPYQHFAAVLLNATQTEQGRRFVLRLKQPKGTTTTKASNSSRVGTGSGNSSSSVLQSLLPQLRSPNPVRRRGIAGMLRNCCLERDSAWWLLNVVKITTHLLYPLAGPEELDVDDKKGLDPDLWLEGPDKQRETDHGTRLFLVEALLLLCATGRASRETLRLQRAYVILKWADMVEECEDVSEQIFECVNFLRRDEEGTTEGSSDKLVDEAYARKPTVARQIGGGGDHDDDFDNVD